MTYQVLIIHDAEDDLFDIYRYILEHDSDRKADYVLGKLEEICNNLAQLTERGHIPPELRRISVSSYLELHFKPYRVIYEIEGKQVFVHSVLDGRRDLQYLLGRRLLR